MVSSIALFAVVGLIYLLFIRDRWEHQNSAAILLLVHDAQQLTTEQQFADAKTKYDQLFQLIGDYDLKDKKLQQTVQIAREDATKVSNELIAAGDRLRQEQQQSQVNAQIAQKRQQDEERQTQTQRQADAALAARRQEETRAADQLAAQQQQERVRQEAIANGPRVITGAVWVKQGDGTNIDQRGLKLFILQPTVSQALYTQHYKKLRKTVDDEIAMLHSSRAIYSERTRFAELNESNREKVKLLDSLIGNADDTIKQLDTRNEKDESSTELIFSLIRLVNSTQGVDARLDSDHAVWSAFNHVAEDKAWADIASQIVVAQAQTDANGRYSLQLSRGHYVLYALSQTDNWIAEWAIPIDADAPGFEGT